MEIWERSVDRPLAERAMLLAQLAAPASTPVELARAAIGRRDLSILALREETLGSRMACFVQCLDCRAPLEFSVDARELVALEASPGPDQARRELVAGDVRIAYRLPTGADVAAVAARLDGEMARRELLERCVLGVMRVDGTAGTFDELRDPELDALEAALEACDPVANVSLATTCAQCGRQSEFGLEIVGFFSTELSAIAKRLLTEVDVLARAYHWREADILAMTAVRRRRYVEAALA